MCIYHKTTAHMEGVPVIFALSLVILASRVGGIQTNQGGGIVKSQAHNG